MGYRVQYQPFSKVRGAGERKSGFLSLVGICFLAFLLMVNLLWPEGRAVLYDLLPDKCVEVFASVETMTDRLRGGASVWDLFFRYG